MEMDYNLLTGPLLLALRLFPVFSEHSALLASFSHLEHCNRLGMVYWDLIREKGMRRRGELRMTPDV